MAVAEIKKLSRIAVSVNYKHREVQRLGRTAKEIAAEIGEELIKVKQKLAHGEFGPWCDKNLSFSKHTRARYIKVAEIKSSMRDTFQRADSINDVLEYKPQPKPEPTPEKREVQRLGRTAKEIAAEIGEELIKVKQTLAHGEFTPWCDKNLSFTIQHARRYMKVADVKRNTRVRFDQASSIREELHHNC